MGRINVTSRIFEEGSVLQPILVCASFLLAPCATFFLATFGTSAKDIVERAVQSGDQATPTTRIASSIVLRGNAGEPLSETPWRNQGYSLRVFNMSKLV
jgi:hypothetical protein